MGIKKATKTPMSETGKKRNRDKNNTKRGRRKLIKHTIKTNIKLGSGIV